MAILIGISAVLFAVLTLVCWLIILIDMFKDSVMKGILGLLCSFYVLYYAVFDFDHDNKWLIILGFLLGGGVGGGLLKAGGY